MELNEFVAHFAEQFEETEPSMFTPQTKYHDLEEWSSLIGLSIIAMVSEEYDVALKGNDVKNSVTIEDLFNIVKTQL
ncbi:MAG: acyl carrier protein [Bacteroidales bacterium]|nr:acyl carrier protein [Bacteroidales bacterium]